MATQMLKAKGWQHHTTHTGACDEPEPTLWADCPTCWASGRILEERPGGITYAHICGTCLGVRQVPIARRN